MKFRELWEKIQKSRVPFEMMDHVKNIVEKPGVSIHTPKWDACVADVSASDPNVNAYAVCTARLGDESFKSIDTMNKAERAQVKTEVEKAMDILYAGGVPESLLARQDLEGSETTKADGRVLAREEAKYCATHGVTMQSAINHISNSSRFGIERWEVEEIVKPIYASLKKNEVQRTQEELYDLASSAQQIAEETHAEDEQDALVENIKAVQIKRQTAVINARKNGGSFGKEWAKQYNK